MSNKVFAYFARLIKQNIKAAITKVLNSRILTDEQKKQLVDIAQDLEKNWDILFVEPKIIELCDLMDTLPKFSEA